MFAITSMILGSHTKGLITSNAKDVNAVSEDEGAAFAHSLDTFLQKKSHRKATCNLSDSSRNTGPALRPANILMVREALHLKSKSSLVALAPEDGRRTKKGCKNKSIKYATKNEQPLVYPSRFGGGTLRAVSIIGVVREININVPLASLRASLDSLATIGGFASQPRLRLKELSFMGCPRNDLKVISQRHAHVITICDGTGLLELVVPIFVGEDEERSEAEVEGETPLSEYQKENFLGAQFSMDSYHGEGLGSQTPNGSGRTDSNQKEPNSIQLFDSVCIPITQNEYVHVVAFVSTELAQPSCDTELNVNQPYNQRCQNKSNTIRLCSHSIRVLDQSAEIVFHNMSIIASCQRLISEHAVHAE